MGKLSASPLQRLSAVIAISFAFFVIEIAVGFKTHSLALIADAFHYLNDLVGFIVALAAIIISQRGHSPKEFSFGWQRARLLGAFFNGVFLAALGLSIFLQAIERFISIQKVDQPKLVLIVGGVGLCLNIISATFLHEHAHDHSGHSHSPGSETPDEHTGVSVPNAIEAARLSFDTAGAGVHAKHHHNTSSSKRKASRDLGTMGVFIHVVGDALNNVGVMASAAAILWGKTEGRYYADPAVSLAISFMICATSIPLVKNSGLILLQSAPSGVHVELVKKDLEELPGISSVHELHIWQLDQKKTIASAHVITESDSINRFMEQAQQIGECLHAYGVHSFTVQPEIVGSGGGVMGLTALTSTEEGTGTGTGMGEDGVGTGRGRGVGRKKSIGFARRVACRIKCQEGGCEEPQCCD